MRGRRPTGTRIQRKAEPPKGADSESWTRQAKRTKANVLSVCDTRTYIVTTTM
jgi:hypothetical protein